MIVEPATGSTPDDLDGSQNAGDYCMMIEKGLTWHGVPSPLRNLNRK